MKKAQCIFPLLISFFFLLSCNAQTKTVLTADEFEKAIANDSIQLLDVRTPKEYVSGHIKNSLQADWNDAAEFDRRVAFVDKNKPVYVYCLAGGRSAAAASKLRSMGYQNVLELKGGINAWKAAGKSLEGSSNARQMSIAELDAAIGSAPVVLVDFGAEWCPPCKKMEPILKSLQTKNPDKFIIVKVDGGRDQDILTKYGVTALPVFILFKDGKQTWRKDGVVDEKEFQDLLK